MATEMDKVSALLPIAEYITRTKHDGLLAIMRTPIGWKVIFGATTPDQEEDVGRSVVLEAKLYPLLSEALEETIKFEIGV